MICDFAETYHIFNYRELPPVLVATLLIGLKNDTRTKIYLSGSKVSFEYRILAMMADALNFIAWTHTKDAQKGHKYKKKSILESLIKDPEPNEDIMVFDSVEEYEEFIGKKRGIKDA